MPYISTRQELLAIVIPAAETAKMAIVRPTTHFEVVTADNPDMIRTLEAQQSFIEKRLAEITIPLSDAERASKANELEREFQRSLTLRAIEEQKGLLAALEVHGIPTFQLVEDKGAMETTRFGFYTDQVFATDTGQYYDVDGQLQFIPSRFKNKQRQGEERLAHAQADNLGAQVHILYSKDGRRLTFEGGDIRQMPGRKLFFVGQGHRSDAETSKAIAEVSGYYVLPIKLLQKQFYHIDCCFLPLPNDAAVIYEGDYLLDGDGGSILDEHGWPVIVPGTETMPVESRALIRTIYAPHQLILISKAEALAFATNAAVLQSSKDGRFKMFVNGESNLVSTDDEPGAIATHRRSFTRAHLAEIHAATQGKMDIIEVPYSTIQRSGGSVRCTVQEVACTQEALRLHKDNPFYFSNRLDHLERCLSSSIQQDNTQEPNDTSSQTSSPFQFRDKLEELERRIDGNNKYRMFPPPSSPQKTMGNISSDAISDEEVTSEDLTVSC